jgi:hypothetical protein
MEKKAIDFQGIVDLDRKVVEQLEQYLQSKENYVAQQILHLIPHHIEKDYPHLLDSEKKMGLLEATERFSKKVKNKIEFPEQYRTIQKKINDLIWNYTEVLEGCVTELFQQVREVSIDRWHISISYVVQHVKDLLFRRMEELGKVIHKLESLLEDCFHKFQSQSERWRNWLFKEKTIDPNITKNLQKAEKSLITHFGNFTQQYNEYMYSSLSVEEDLQQMKNYPILAILTMPDQNLYIDLYRLLRILELEPHAKKGIKSEIVKSLKQLSSIDNIITILRVYLREMRESLFSSSLEWKSLDRNGENYFESQERLVNKVKNFEVELAHYLHTVSRYRLFILENDPNPYVRSRWGFTEWIVGPEPARGKKLLQLVYAGQELQQYFKQFAESLTKDLITVGVNEYQAHQRIDGLLHEMTQPFISKAMMKSRVEKMLQELKGCNEIGSPTFTSIYATEEILSRAMRLDWKYQVLIGFPEFHEIYHLHHGITEYFSDPSHSFRLDRFQELFSQIQKWVKNDNVTEHIEEIELDMNDMKTILQDFLATVQRAVREKSMDPFLDETTRKYQQQLLEYRYAFSQFFANIYKRSSHGTQLRNQFIFVDQYFESVESLLNELKQSVKRKK